MLKCLYAAALLAGVSGSAFAAPATGPSPILQQADLFSLEAAASPEISPDGSRIAYVRLSGDVMSDRMRPSIWLVDTRTGEQMPLAAGPGAHSQPRWSPDGKRLAYISTAEGGASQLFVRWMESGESVRITGLPDSPSAIEWSPDGRQIAYAMFVPDEGLKLGAPATKPEGAKWAEPLEIISAVTYRADGEGYLKPGYSHIFVVSSDGGAPRQLSFGAVNDNGPLSWSPDGRTLYFSGNRSPNWEREPVNSEVYQLDVASGAVTALTDRIGPDANPVVSPDGSKIAYLGFDDRKLGYQNVALYVMDRSGANRRILTGSLDRSVDSPVWAADGRSVYVSYDDEGATKVARVGLDGSIRTVAEGLSGAALDRPYTGGSFSVARDGTIAISRGSATRPPDVAVVRNGAARQLTRLNAELLERKSLGEVRKIPVTAFDTRPIGAWLTLPPSYSEGQRVPLILEIHGGPYAAYGPHFSTDYQLYCSAGYAVLYTNPRGSTGYG
ncbi:MAG TPA: DPP IV N-terminal domain-containing protein, partial [Allosphingosinicella sp.]